jgi:hypothetical protein
VVAELRSTAARVAEVHIFGKGLGIAAPQIGIDRAAVIVRPPGGDSITLLNPRIVEESAETDEQYEGCLSFFDVRGMVPRPLVLHVEHQDINGQPQITTPSLRERQSNRPNHAGDLRHQVMRLVVDRQSDRQMVSGPGRGGHPRAAHAYRMQPSPEEADQQVKRYSRYAGSC